MQQQQQQVAIGQAV